MTPKAVAQREAFLGLHPQGAVSTQDLVSWVLTAISPVTALRATRMWREETNHGALPDLWTAEAVCTSVAGGMFTVEEGHSRGAVGYSFQPVQ